MRERMAERNEVRVNALEQPFRPGFGDADQTNAVTQGRGLGDIGGQNMTDPAGCDVVESGARAERQAREDRQLVRRVDAIDVETGIGFRETQRLGLGQDVGEAAGVRQVVLISFAAAPSRRPLMTGTPPATAASNLSAALAASAASASSSP